MSKLSIASGLHWELAEAPVLKGGYILLLAADAAIWAWMPKLGTSISARQIFYSPAAG